MPHQLWAPWRMKYILNAKKDEGCFLCNAGASRDDETNLVIHRAELCFCLLNRYPYNNGHLLVAPFAHKADFCELTKDESAEIMCTLGEMQNRLRDAMRPDGFNIGVNIGKTSGAGLPGHLHFHIVPRWEGDTNFMPVLADTKVIPQALEEVFRMLMKK